MKKKLLVLLVAVFAFIPFVNAEELEANKTYENTISFASAEIKDLKDTTEGIILEDTYGNNRYDIVAYLKYTIPEDIDLEKSNGVITLNLIKDITNSNFIRYGSFGLCGGSRIEVHLSIINNSKYEFELKEGDLIISSVIYNNENSEGTVVETFDGNELDVTSKYNINRSTNIALRKLLGKNDLSDSDVTDENINKALLNVLDEERNKKYPNGIDDLDKYYLDFFNEKNNTNYTSLYELSEDDIDTILGSNKYPIQSGANHTSVLESNSTVAKLGYDYFYNRVVTVIPEGETDKYNKKYSVGEYMRDTAPDTLEEQVKDYVNKMSEEDETVIKSYLYGSIGNSYQGYSFGLNISVKLSTPSYKVTVKYVDDYGKTLAEDVVEEYLDGKEYKTEEKTFEGYELTEVKGERTGTINKKDVEVIYIYQFVLGEGGDEKEEEPTNLVQTGSEVDHSLMTSALITASLIVLALRTKKKNN